MFRHLNYPCLYALLISMAAGAQKSTQTIDSVSNRSNAEAASTVALIYVSSLVAHGHNAQVIAYTADPTGKLTVAADSPYKFNIGKMAVNGSYLLGSELGRADVEAYRMEPSGDLSFEASANVPAPSEDCGSAGPNVPERGSPGLLNAAYLFNADYLESRCADDSLPPLMVQKSSGKLIFLGDPGDSGDVVGDLSLAANNKFAYSSDCYRFGPSIYGFRRKNDGALSELPIHPALPKAVKGEGWCPYLAASDGARHLAIPMYPWSQYGSQDGPYQLATYSVNSSGQLTTSSTYFDMPKVMTGSITDVNMDPSGSLLAVAGTGGVQIFHFNGGKPITRYTGLLTTEEVDQVFWDSNGHLYAIGQSANKLWVFNVTSTESAEAPGSPYAVNEPLGLIVQPLPLESPDSTGTGVTGVKAPAPWHGGKPSSKL
jgi:6-phosphogluconolactonase (cycloisomerase 2 family)